MALIEEEIYEYLIFKKYSELIGKLDTMNKQNN